MSAANRDESRPLGVPRGEWAFSVRLLAFALVRAHEQKFVAFAVRMCHFVRISTAFDPKTALTLEGNRNFAAVTPVIVQLCRSPFIIKDMDLLEWHLAFGRLTDNLEIIRNWKPDEPNTEAKRCELSRHRTLAHLRACQEQWLCIALTFIEKDDPSIRVQHPWRLFDNEKYEFESWDSHMNKFIADRVIWLGFKDAVNRERGGKWNGKVDNVSGLTRRLLEHESHHIAILKHQST